MSLSTVRAVARGRRGFTIVETMVASIVAGLVFMAAVSVYMMAWRWWAEVAPRIEAQKVCRVALASIIEGKLDATAGTYAVGSTTYGRRNGIAWASDTPDIPSTSRINFHLDKTGETTNLRSFYLATDSASQLKAVYYLDSNNAAHLIKPTLGITNLQFEKYGGLNNLIKVTATVDKTVAGTRRNSYRIIVEYSEVIYLRSVASL